MNASEKVTRRRDSVAAVLEFAWNEAAFRADDIIATLGLTRSTSLAAVDTLIHIGLIQELPSVSASNGSRMGRPARQFELRRDAGFLVGLDAGDTHFTAVVGDLGGNVVARAQGEVRSFYDASAGEPDPQVRRDKAFEVIEAALLRAGRSRADVISVGIGIPAPVDGDGRSPNHQAGFWQHMNAGLQEALSAAFPAVRLENDASLAAIAEGSLGQARGCDHYVAMLSGRRLGSGVVVGGDLLRGAHGGIGELEALTYVSGVEGSKGFGPIIEDWVRGALASGKVPAEHPWGRMGVENVTAEAVLAAAPEGDELATSLLEDVGHTLGIIGGVLGRVYDPEVVVVCGSMAAALGEVVQLAASRMEAEAELPPPRLVASELGGDVVGIGAASAAREAARAIALDLFSSRAREGK